MTSLPILLPDGFTPVVKTGDKIIAQQIIAQNSQSSQGDSGYEEVVDLPEQLGLSAEKVAKAVRKNPGDSIEPGDVLASNMHTFGLQEIKVIAKAEGTVLRFERDSGRLVIRLSEPEGEMTHETTGETILSPVTGEVMSVSDHEVVLSTEEKAVVGEYGSGHVGEGELRELRGFETIEEYMAEITARDAGKILLLPKADKQIIAKSDAIGVTGLICETLFETDQRYLQEKRLDFPLVKLPEVEYKRIVKQVGKRVLVNGETRAILVLSSA